MEERLLLYARANVASHGQRFVQVTTSDDGGSSWSAFTPISIDGYVRSYRSSRTLRQAAAAAGAAVSVHVLLCLCMCSCAAVPVCMRMRAAVSVCGRARQVQCERARRMLVLCGAVGSTSPCS